MRFHPLDNPVREYAWGSPTAIPRLLGIPETGRPAAELWIGAHPDSPSRSTAHPDTPGLDRLIEQNPAGALGTSTVAEFGPRLPFLLKVLAAERALSIQVHPNSAQAEAGYQTEQAAGLPPDSPERNYRDRHHKPEMAYALTDFDAFCGFRPVERTAQLLTALDVEELLPYRDVLISDGGLRAVFTTLLTLGGATRGRLIEATVAGCRRLAGGTGEWAEAAAASVLAAGDFPDDIGPVLALLLNYVRLAPGEAIFLPAGNVHAYLRGVCVELLASSDNVLRCGLTGKHIDVAELVRIADFSPTAEPRRSPTRQQPDRVDFELPVPDFTLSVRRSAGQLAGDRPYLVLAADGPVRLRAGGELCELPPWRAAFVEAAGDDGGTSSADGASDGVEVLPEDRVFVASVALPSDRPKI